MEKISFCIPCYRSEKTIKTVIKEIEYEMNKTTKYDYEIVCVVDGSPDDVFGILCDLGKNNRRIKVVNLARNFGQAGARMASLYYATGEYMVCLDMMDNALWTVFGICLVKLKTALMFRLQNT